ncbi:MAG: hypothetical protein LBU57_00420 [Dysgonamonadaceae bacterium]|jgi:hypothetical protein|nr:hypothetical protein [Dysgonamonadaceae bacterium]
MEQLAIFIFGGIGGVALLVSVALYVRHRRIVAWKNRALIDRTIENTRLEKELKQAQIEKQVLEKLVKDKLEGKEETDVKL